MNLMLMRIMQREVGVHVQYALICAQQLERINPALDAEDSNTQIQAEYELWFWVQALLNSTANVSKLLWGQGGEKAVEREALRDSLQVPDDSPLAETRMRNNFEHIDERLERWDKQSPNHNFIDGVIGPPNFGTGDALGPIDTFRTYHPPTGVLGFWGQEFHIPQIIKALRTLAPIAQVEAAKPHWEEPPPT